MRYYERRFFDSFKFNELKKGENRINRWQASFDVIKEKPWIGWGSGDIKAIRKQNFYEHGLSKAANRGYNEHNQYIEIIATDGLIGLILFFIQVSVCMFAAIKSGKRFFLIFYTFFIFACITESVLERNKGVVLYAILTSITLSISLNEISKEPKANAR